MKEFEEKVEKLSNKAKRVLAKRQASKCASVARKFRADSLKLGLKMHKEDSNVYRIGHPVYEELVLPLLEEAAKIASKHGFNILFQVHTPVEELPELTSCIGSFNQKTMTNTMRGCIELISSRPLIGRANGRLITEPRVEPLLKSDNEQLI